MLYLNGEFIDPKNAKISVFDRGFLFADGVYEVVPVYEGKPFRIKQHLDRLEHSLASVQIKNPNNYGTWCKIIDNLIDYQQQKTLVIYIQITRGSGNKREHISSNNLSPTVLVKAKELKLPTFAELQQPHRVITSDDIRWQRCDIKSIALLANVLLLKQAYAQQAEEVILVRNGKITEGASSNIFIVKDNIVYTHPANKYILGGITRNVVIQSLLAQGIILKEEAFLAKDLDEVDEVWISSSTKEITPISHINNNIISNKSSLWQLVYKQFQAIKQSEL